MAFPLIRNGVRKAPGDCYNYLMLVVDNSEKHSACGETACVTSVGRPVMSGNI